MKIFPTKTFKFQIEDTIENNMNLLYINTCMSDVLGTISTDKLFIGKINPESFELISSEIGIGAFSVLKGNFINNTIILKFEINKPFKILISILFFFVLFAILLSAIQLGFPKAFGMLVPFIMFSALIKFVFFGLFFKKSSDLIFYKIIQLLKIKMI